MKKPVRTRSAHLADKLLHIRLKLNLSQAEILSRLGFSDELFRSNISQYERGTRVPPPPVLLAYSRVAGVLMEDIVDDKIKLPRRLPRAKMISPG
jgi:transcriptional regulator with XRE-family HTH domain